MKIILSLLLTAALIAPTAASACGPYVVLPPFEWELNALQYEVDREAESGQLTETEATRVRRTVARARRLQTKANRDNQVTPAEVRQVTRAIARAERTLKRLATNKRRVAAR